MILGKVAPTVHFVRHAQGYHNLSIGNQSMHDPSLTPLGEAQCYQLCQDFPYHGSVDLLVASPLRRTLYTMLLGFQPEVKRGLTIIALPEAQELADLPCDTGSNVQLLREEFHDQAIDFSLVEEGWNSKEGKWAADAEFVEKRAREVRQWLKARPEKDIVLVTHGGFLHFLTEDWSDSTLLHGSGWANTEFRSYNFTLESGDNASIVETAASRQRRRGSETPLSQTEQRELKAAKQNLWDERGYFLQSKV
ncbi:hypothetical protein MMC11_005757 [Xylographa trunciseda]|nr:hypothetical protein [Xylographa trunciseda]